MNVLVIPEDHRQDRYMLLPLVSALLASVGFARPKVRICDDPLMGGVTEALKAERLEEVFTRYGRMIDVYLLCIDRDAEPRRQARLDALEETFRDRVRLVATQAWEEIETWVLAGIDLPRDWRWRDIRAERDVKEAYFVPLARAKGLSSEPGGGRRTLGIEAARHIPLIRRRCSDDFDRLGRRLEELRRIR